MSDADPNPSTTATAPPPAPHRHRGRRWLAGVALVVVLLLGATVGAAWWALKSESGTAWLLTHVPGLTVTDSHGALIGDFSADHLAYELAGGRKLQIDGIEWRGVDLGRAPSGMWLRLSIADLHIHRLVVPPGGPKPAPTTPSEAPKNLKLPVELEIASLRVDELDFGAPGTKPVRDLVARVHLGADQGAVHRIDRLKLSWNGIAVKGSAQIAAAAPLQLDARLEASQGARDGLPEWNATVSAVGPLASPLVEATVRAPAAAGKPAQSIEGHATLKLYEPWPLGKLDLTLKALDLSTFGAALPATSLSGNVTADTHGTDQPSVVTSHVANAAAGRWDESRLPLRSVDAEIRVRPTKLDRIELSKLDAELGSADKVAGHVHADGQWTPREWHLDAKLDGVRTVLLDARAPALTLFGPLAVGATGIDPASTELPPVDVKGELDGELAEGGAKRPVRAVVDATVSPARIEVRKAELHAGDAGATIHGSASRTAVDAPWQVKADLGLSDFDPANWIPAPAGSPLKKGPHRLNAKGSIDLAIPPSLAGKAPLEAASAVRGRADLTITKSQLAGVTLQGDIAWRNDGAGAPHARVDLDLAGNRFKVDGSIGAGKGAADEWTAKIAAPALKRLAPLWALLQPDAKTSAAPSGALDVSAHVRGRWPQVQSQGHLDASKVHLGPIGLQQARARWTLGTAPTAPLEIDATLRGATLNGPTIDSLSLKVDGSARSHRIDLHAVSNLLPPAWTSALQADATPAATAAAAAREASSREAPPPRRTRSVARLQAHGSLDGNAPDAFTGWHGTIGRLEVRSNAKGAPPWIEAHDLVVDGRWADGPVRLSLQPGRITLLGAGLRWSRFSFRAAAPAAPMQLDVAAELDPLPVAPLLRQAQPAFGWSGDLRIGGHVNVKTGNRVTADIVLERRSGDLRVTEETRTESLGLTDLRAGIEAHDGVWNVTLALAGKTIGVASGAIVARPAAGALWPEARTPIDGVLKLAVDDLGTLATWIPAGWRVGGALRADARIGGTVGAPEYTGKITGTKLAMRNFLEGVDIHDGDLAIALQGTTAKVEHFTARAGDGTLSIGGNASFGGSPKAKLQIAARRFQLLGRVDRRIVASGDAQVRLDGTDAAVNGRFKIDEGLIDISRGNAPTLASDVHVIRDASGPLPPPGSAESTRLALKTAGVEAPRDGKANPKSKLDLDVWIDIGGNLRVRGHGLDSLLKGKLHITSPEGRLAVNGTISTVNGTFASYGEELKIDRGRITFTGPIDNPRLDIEATRPKLDVKVGVRVTGTALNPRIQLFSEPEMSETEKLSWLVLGRSSEGLGRGDSALLQRAAMALIAGEGGGGGGVTDRITKSLGLDELSFSQGAGGDLGGTIVTLGKKLSDRWSIAYERGLNATTGSWQLIYRIAQRFTLRAQTGDDNAVDLTWTWRWH